MEQETPRLVQQSFEIIKRNNIDHFDREFVPRDGKPHREGCFPPEQTKTTAAHLEVITSKASLR